MRRINPGYVFQIGFTMKIHWLDNFKIFFFIRMKSLIYVFFSLWIKKIWQDKILFQHSFLWFIFCNEKYYFLTLFATPIQERKTTSRFIIDKKKRKIKQMNHLIVCRSFIVSNLSVEKYTHSALRKGWSMKKN